MSAEQDDAGNSASGITTTASGERLVASSVRPDGTVRKEIRIRPGFTPQEDVATYKNRTAEAWKNRGKGGVPGAEALGEKPSGKENAVTSKNAKRRAARKRAAAAVPEGGDKDQEKEQEQETATQPVQKQDERPEEADAEATKAKEARKLSKKLRQARELKDKREKGDALLPEQLEKVIRINELVRQLEQLGFDSNGDLKAEGT